MLLWLDAETAAARVKFHVRSTNILLKMTFQASSFPVESKRLQCTSLLLSSKIQGYPKPPHPQLQDVAAFTTACDRAVERHALFDSAKKDAKFTSGLSSEPFENLDT